MSEKNQTIWNNRFYYSMGVFLAYLKNKGHSVSLHQFKESVRTKDINKILKDEKPDVIAISSLSMMFEDAVLISKKCKIALPDSFIVYGGVHATVASENIKKIKWIDAWCIGEGEEAFAELLDKLVKDEDYMDVKNFYFRTSSEIKKNKCRPPIKNLDMLPFSDLDVTDFENSDDYKIFKRFPIMAARGCAFDCDFCCNNVYHKIYGNSYFRFRSPENICNEIKQVISKYPDIEYIQFQNDIFFPSIKWLEEFEKLYNSEIGLPLSILLASSQINEESIKIIKRLPIREVFVGVETSAKLLGKIGKKGKTNIDSFKPFRLLKKENIKIATFNMMGIPDETGEDILEGVILNSKITPKLIQLSYLYPFNSTRVYDLYKRNISKYYYLNYFQGSIFKKRSLNKHIRFYYINFIAFIEIFSRFKENNKYISILIFKVMFKDCVPVSIKRMILRYYKKNIKKRSIFNVRF